MSRRRPGRALRSFALLVLLTLTGTASAAERFRLLGITPSGEDVEPDTTQIVLAFDRPVVPLGRMVRNADEVPVTITPAVDCRWRWLDESHLACELPSTAPLPPATAYRVQLAPTLTGLDGARLVAGGEGRFITRRPQVQHAFVQHWRAPTLPELRVRFDQPVTAASVQASLRIDGRGVQVEPWPDDSDTPYWVPALQGQPAGEARQTWLLLPAQPLPPEHEAALSVEAGLVSALGPERSVQRGQFAPFRTFGPFRVIGFDCRSNGGELRPARLPDTACDPLAGPVLRFSAPVAPREAGAALTISPPPPGSGGDHDPWAELWMPTDIGGDNLDRDGHALRLPLRLKAAQEYLLQLPTRLRDRFGRPLESVFDARFRTDHRPPALSFPNELSVLEAGVDSEVPVYVTNLDRLDLDVLRSSGDGEPVPLRLPRAVPAVRDLAVAMPLDVRALLDGRSGVVDGWLRTVPPTRDYPPERPGERLFAQVTPWQMHAKLGHADTLVWLTEFATGRPVAGATIDAFLSTPPRWQPDASGALAQATTDADGLAVLPGAATLDPKLAHSGWGATTPLTLRARRGAEQAVLPLTPDFDVNIYRASDYTVYDSRQPRHGHLRAWGTTAQGVYRSGDTVQYKVYVRDSAGRQLAAAPAGPYRLRVIDPTGATVHERAGLTLSAFGALDGEFRVPKQGAVGWYRFELEVSYSRADRRSWGEQPPEPDVLQPMDVLVSDFTPTPFKLATEIRATAAEPGADLVVATRARLHAGGAFSGAPATLSARLQARPFTIAEGPLAPFTFTADGGPDSVGVGEWRGATDADGELRATVTPPVGELAWGEFVVDAQVQDDRGRSIAAGSRVPYRGRDRLIGLHGADWLLAVGRRSEVESVVVDADGQPVAGVPAYVRIERQVAKSARVRDAGNAYTTHVSRRWETLAVCKGRSKAAPVPCAFTPDEAGEYRITAMVRDRRNRLHVATLNRWATGANAVVWDGNDDLRLPLVAERSRYRVGEVARVLVRNPWPGATALITTERYGVLDHRVQVLEGSAPVLDVPITEAHAPGFYLSVVLQSPRVAAPPPERDVDLGKPAQRMGYLAFDVAAADAELAVQVRADAQRYRPGDTARLTLTTRSREPVEYAVAVVDEAVFDLVRGGEAYYDPRTGLTRLEPLDLANFSLLSRLVGRQKFEKKGATPGGDGGVDLSLRTIDRFVAYWNPALAADAGGKAELSFRLPDNLTAWKVLVLAATPTARFGLGRERLLSSRDTEIRPLLPNQLIDGDQFEAAFSVMNRTDTARTLDVVLIADGAATARRRETLRLAPFERRRLALPVTVAMTPGGEAGIRFEATAGDARDRDALRVAVPVNPPMPTRTAARFGLIDAGEQTQPIELPAGSLAATLALRLSPSVVGQLDGAFGYLRDYPYQCWEQRLSRAVMARQRLALTPWLGPADSAWPGAEALATEALDEAISFQASNGGMAYWSADEAAVSPYLSAYTALAFEWLRASGLTPPAAVQVSLDRYLDGLLRADAAGLPTEANASLRALVLAVQARRGRLPVAELERLAPSLPRMDLFGQALFLDAAQRLPGARPLAAQARALLLARSERSAGQLLLRDTPDPAAAELLGTPLRGNCAALSALLGPDPGADADDPGSAALSARLVQGIDAARGAGGHWSNPQENVFCATAIADYARRHERDAPAFSLQATLAGTPLAEARFERRDQPPVSRSTPLTEAQIGRPLPLSIRHEGRGRGYWTARLRYAEPVSAATATSAGLDLSRRYAVHRDGRWQPLTGPELRLRQGERLRVELVVGTPVARTHLIVDDPLPGGLEPLNPDLATASGLLATDLEPPDSAWPFPFQHRELRFAAARWAGDRVPAGQHRLVWIGQAIAVGRYTVPAARSEAMYAPEIFGTDVPRVLVVEPAAAVEADAIPTPTPTLTPASAPAPASN